MAENSTDRNLETQPEAQTEINLSWSEQIYKELTGRRHHILFKQFVAKDIDWILKEFKSTEDELKSQNLLDAAILYTIVTKDNEYSGAYSSSFKEMFESNEEISEFSIQLSAKVEGQRKLRQLDFRASTLTSPSKGNLNVIFVSGDDPTWVSNTYSRFVLALNRTKTVNKIIYSPWTELIVQLLVVLGVMAISIYAARRVSDSVALPYAQVYVFATFFLLGSNLWTFLSKALISLRGKHFPVISFKKRSIETVILSILIFLALAITTWSVTTLLDFVSKK